MVICNMPKFFNSKNEVFEVSPCVPRVLDPDKYVKD